MIPRLIHQTAKTADIPEQWRGFQRRVRELHPDWTYRLWTDEDNLAFVASELPDFLGVFTRLPKNIMRADAIRYVLMYKLGGLYLDLDFEMLKPFDLTQYDCVLPLETDGEFGPTSRVGNAFFASAPGHPFFKAVLDDLRAHPPIGEDVNVLTATGPLYITSVLQRLEGRGQLNLCTPGRELFNPTIPRSTRAYRALVARGVSYGIHHCHGSWRDFTFAQRVRNKISHVIHRYI